ncbi:hypothetical protein FYT42_08450 [Campylobacter jejuni]|nr:hypothetical protein [Campylobacter jejuni]EAO7171977.1 hypothetical protein [Campylobacter jejuni]ECL0520162.1 hypothetical protein [Campylobacter jejuni]ECP1117295.1 hypothetical protein [Campylobacter jejuni]HEC1947897.1 hypothetical protein [Campylobacter jejuni]
MINSWTYYKEFEKCVKS